MKNEETRPTRAARALTASVLLVLLAVLPLHSEVFDDISASAQSLHHGETSHGYIEIRVLLENRSPRNEHVVTLVYPERAWPSGNSINRLSRTVMLPPGARAAVTLWQPPLPANGGSAILVETDGERAGSLHFPGGRHASHSYRYGGVRSSIFASRNLDFTEIENAFQATAVRKFFTPEMATGAPDGGRSFGMNPESWSPDFSSSGAQWLELDYSTPVAADRLRIFANNMATVHGTITLMSESGTNLTTFPMTLSTSMRSGRGRSSSPTEITFTGVTQEVKTVRIDFSPTAPHQISVDAVELAGATAGAWATDARASSDASASAPPSRSSSSGPSRNCLRAEFPVSEWSEHWLAYSAYDAILLSTRDLPAMPPGVADALGSYLQCGGNLFVFGHGNIPEAWALRSASSIPDGRRYSSGFGHCFVFDSEKVSSADAAAVQAIANEVDTFARYWQSLPTDDSANNAFRVVDNLKIPVRGMVFIMLGFVLLIGPVNIIVLSRLKRRTWLLWTIPAISFVTCLLVFTYSLVREGVTPDVRIESVTILDQGSRNATTIGAQAFYCPLTPGEGLVFDHETEVTPLVETDFSSGGTARDVDWTSAQHLRRGWITARVPAHFFLRKSETRRERLQVERDGNNFSVVNGLGAPIRSLWLADASGRIYTAGQIAAGEQVRLQQTTDSLADASVLMDSADIIHKAGYGTHISMLTNNPTTFLRAGTYIAQLDDAPFLENGLGPRARKSRSRSTAVVLGVLESAEAQNTATRSP